MAIWMGLYPFNKRPFVMEPSMRIPLAGHIPIWIPTSCLLVPRGSVCWPISVPCQPRGDTWLWRPIQPHLHFVVLVWACTCTASHISALYFLILSWPCQPMETLILYNIELKHPLQASHIACLSHISLPNFQHLRDYSLNCSCNFWLVSWALG